MLKGLKWARERKGFSQTELAERLGVKQPYISYLENGERENPSLAFIQQTAALLGVPIETLLNGRPEDAERRHVRDAIEEKRAELNKIGLGHPDTLRISQELDKLINREAELKN